MFIANPHVKGLSGPEWSRLKELVERFEEAWLRGARPAIEDYLPAEPPARRSVLLELIHTDLELRLKAGELISTEDYQRRYPEFDDDRPALLDLITAEYQLQCRILPSPDRRSTCGAFHCLPQCRPHPPRPGRLLSQSRQPGARHRPTGRSGLLLSDGPGLAGRAVPRTPGGTELHARPRRHPAQPHAPPEGASG